MLVFKISLIFEITLQIHDQTFEPLARFLVKLSGLQPPTPCQPGFQLLTANYHLLLMPDQ